MDKDTIIRMAREAGLERVVELRDDGTRTVELPHPDLLERFAALVAAAEREECAKVLEKLEQEWEDAELWASFKTIGIAIDAIRSKK